MACTAAETLRKILAAEVSGEVGKMFIEPRFDFYSGWTFVFSTRIFLKKFVHKPHAALYILIVVFRPVLQLGSK